MYNSTPIYHPDSKEWARLTATPAELASLDAEARAERERRLAEQFVADQIAVLTQNAVERFGKDMGTLLGQGLSDGILSLDEFVGLTPPLHRRIVYAVRLTVRSLRAYTSGLFNGQGDQST